MMVTCVQERPWPVVLSQQPIYPCPQFQELACSNAVQNAHACIFLDPTFFFTAPANAFSTPPPKLFPVSVDYAHRPNPARALPANHAMRASHGGASVCLLIGPIRHHNRGVLVFMSRSLSGERSPDRPQHRPTRHHILPPVGWFAYPDFASQHRTAAHPGRLPSRRMQHVAHLVQPHALLTRLQLHHFGLKLECRPSPIFISVTVLTWLLATLLQGLNRSICMASTNHRCGCRRILRHQTSNTILQLFTTGGAYRLRKPNIALCLRGSAETEINFCEAIPSCLFQGTDEYTRRKRAATVIRSSDIA